MNLTLDETKHTLLELCKKSLDYSFVLTFRHLSKISNIRTKLCVRRKVIDDSLCIADIFQGPTLAFKDLSLDVATHRQTIGNSLKKKRYY